ncbi:hypothetical protein FB106_102170 [Synechococcus sp. Ace-Pa]|nr:hypothetical protein FB106_102170 [Synechococcus sp. Ace-Pa]
MEEVVPWQSLIDLIEPSHPKTSKKGGRPPYPLATMPRIHIKEASAAERFRLIHHLQGRFYVSLLCW